MMDEESIMFKGYINLKILNDRITSFYIKHLFSSHTSLLHEHMFNVVWNQFYHNDAEEDIEVIYVEYCDMLNETYQRADYD
jgi:hypothetical protein